VAIAHHAVPIVARQVYTAAQYTRTTLLLRGKMFSRSAASNSLAGQCAAKLCITVLSAAVLAACGGGGSSAPAPTPDVAGTPSPAPTLTPAPTPNATPSPTSTPTPTPPAAAIAYADCIAWPIGVTNTYRNGPVVKRTWQDGAQFEGQTGLARRDSFDAQDRLTQVRYAKFDMASRSYSLVGQETVQAGTGEVVQRLQYQGYTRRMDLDVGQSEAITYTVKTLVPAEVADITQQETAVYEGQEQVTLTAEDDALTTVLLNTCKLRYTINAVSEDVVHTVPGAGIVKLYSTRLSPGYSDSGQTYGYELAASSASLNYEIPQSASSLDLMQCAVLSDNLQQTFTQPFAGSSVYRSTRLDSLQGQSAIAQARRNVDGALLSTQYFDPAQGILKRLGSTQHNELGDVTSTTVITAVPELRATALGQSVTYAAESSVFRATNPAPQVTQQATTFTYLGTEPVIVPAGRFDACKVQFSTENLQEIHHLVPQWGAVRTVQRYTAQPSALAVSYELLRTQ
jgi:hypothetical protein